MAKAKAWLAATRPKTLAAGIVPVCMAAALAYADGGLYLSMALLALVCATGIQVATNFINEVYDFRKGADTAERLGPTRLVAAGVISEKQMTLAAWLVIIGTFLLGLVLSFHAGWGIFIVGMLSLVFAWAYTGGPFPLAYKGLGEVFVFLFFGLIAVSGTYYVQTLELGAAPFILALAPAALSANILGVNNLRDIHTDPKAGKITLAVRIGEHNARRMYCAFMILAYAVPFLLLAVGYGIAVLLPLLSLPPALRLCRDLYRRNGSELNAVLAGTAKLLALYGLLCCLGLVLSPHVLPG